MRFKNLSVMITLKTNMMKIFDECNIYYTFFAVKTLFLFISPFIYSHYNYLLWIELEI